MVSAKRTLSNALARCVMQVQAWMMPRGFAKVKPAMLLSRVLLIRLSLPRLLKRGLWGQDGTSGASEEGGGDADGGPRGGAPFQGDGALRGVCVSGEQPRPEDLGVRRGGCFWRNTLGCVRL